MLQSNSNEMESVQFLAISFTETFQQFLSPREIPKGSFETWMGGCQSHPDRCQSPPRSTSGEMFQRGHQGLFSCRVAFMVRGQPKFKQIPPDTPIQTIIQVRKSFFFLLISNLDQASCIRNYLTPIGSKKMLRTMP